MIVIKAKKRRAQQEDDDGGGDDFKILKLATTVDEKGDSGKISEAVTKILATKKTAPRSYEELKQRYKKSCASSTKLAGVKDRETREARDEQRFRLVLRSVRSRWMISK